MTTRIYAVKQTGKIVALVRASTPSTALAHIAAKTWTAEKPTTDEVIAATTAGIVVEVAGEVPPVTFVHAAAPSVEPAGGERRFNVAGVGGGEA